MNLPNLEGVEIPKRISAAIVGAVVVAQMPEVDSTIKACLVAGIIIAGIISQTVTDVKGKKT
jgi:hypothetical protein